MKDYERDYPDFRKTPFHEHGDEVPSNHSTKPTMYGVIEARTLRRGFMVGGLAALATGLFGGAVTTRAALAQTTAVSGLLGFAPVPLSKDDTVVVPEGYRVQILPPPGHAPDRRHASLRSGRQQQCGAGHAGRNAP